MTEEKVVKLNIDLLLSNPYQPRKKFDENSIKELALSIREYGILNPILVRPKNDKYEIIAGERRTRAAKLLNMHEIPAIVKQIDDEKMAEIALIENLQRENITPIEEAITYQYILKNTNKTEKELSEMIGKSQPFIANKIRLLNLPKKIQEALIEKRISERHARSLLIVKEESEQIKLLEKIISERLSVKDLDNIIKTETKERKEEKESDNMNNGNFFPNLNNTPDANNNQASLNSMNIQAMPNSFTYQPEQAAGPAMQPVPTPVMPQVAPIPPVENATMAPMPSQINPTMAPEINQPVANMPIEEALPSMPGSESTPVMPVAPEPPVIQETAPVNDIPLFSAPEFNSNVEPAVSNAAPMEVMAPVANEAPAVEPILQPEAPIESSASVTAMSEPPLFNQELAGGQPEIAQNPIETSFEVPVTANNNPAPTDNFTKVTELLNSNGVQYKAYSNENGHCIIIEV